MVPQNVCGSSSGTYTQSIRYQGNFFARSTNIPCTYIQGGRILDNGVWIENANTIPSSNWDDYIQTAISATSAWQFKNSYSNYQPWTISGNRDYDCRGPTFASSVIMGSLNGGGTAIWQNKANILPWCDHPGGGLSIYAVNMKNGKFIDGIFTNVYNPSGTLIATGYTPLYVTLLNTGTYNIDFANYGSLYFTTTYSNVNYHVANWGGGRIPFTISSASGQHEVVAYYYDNLDPGNFSKIIYESQPPTGMFIATQTSSGDNLSRGFTPHTVGAPRNISGTPSQDVTVIWNDYDTWDLVSTTTNANQQSLVLAPWGGTQVIRPTVAGGGANYYDRGNFS